MRKILFLLWAMFTLGNAVNVIASDLRLYPVEKGRIIVDNKCEANAQLNCAHFGLNSNSLQLIPAYSSQSSDFAQTLVGMGLSELE